MAITHAYGGRAPGLVAMNCAELAIATVVILLRLWQRAKHPVYGDWALLWALLAWIVSVVWHICLMIAISYGFGLHRSQLEEAQAIQAMKFVWVGMPLKVLDYGFGKLSAIAFLLDVHGPTHEKRGKWLKAIGVVNVSQGAVDEPNVS